MPKRILSESQKQKARDKALIRYRLLVKSKICIYCRNPAKKNKILCETCLIKKTTRYEQRRARGLCGKCGKTSKYSYCNDCAAIRNEKERARYNEKQN